MITQQTFMEIGPFNRNDESDRSKIHDLIDIFEAFRISVYEHVNDDGTYFIKILNDEYSVEVLKCIRATKIVDI